jgi:hypothetical protein
MALISLTLLMKGESTWDHPCDGYYKRLYEEEKKKKAENTISHA